MVKDGRKGEVHMNFRALPTDQNKGLGLRNLFSRTEILEGNMYVDSSEGKGVKLTFEIPV